MDSKKRVLYIEDDTTSRILVQVLLANHYDIFTAPNGLEGLDIVQRKQPDLVLTDLNLPDLHGEMIAARIRATSGRDIPIIAVTSDDAERTRIRAIAAGCTGFITKPIDGVNFPALVQKYLDGHTDEISDVERKRATDEIHHDLTAKVEITLRQLQEDNAELRNLEQVKTAFLTQVSHELRTPLTVLSGYAQMLFQTLTEGEVITAMHRELSQEIIESTRRMHNIMNEIVVMARLASNQFDASRAPLHFNEAAEDAITEYEEAFRVRNITFERLGSGWQEIINGDITLLRMAINNLISNAIKATPNDGKITMSVERDQNKLHIIIADTGIGIHPEQMPLLFKPFFTAIDVKRGKTSKTQFMGMGMGIGLPIVTKIVEAHKGQIWAESAGYDEKECPGSRFHVLLPLSKQS